MDPRPSHRRREQLFERACLAFVSMTPLFYGAGVLQPRGEHRTLVFVMTTVAGSVALAGWALSRRGRIALGIDLFCVTGMAAIVGGTAIAGRAGPVVWLLSAVVVIASIHRDTRRILVLLGLVAASLAVMWVRLTPIHPAQFPTLAGLLGVVGAITFFTSRMNHDIQADEERANDDLRQANQQLVVERNRAEAANAAKTIFLATMSHELRTPLNAILGYTGMLTDAIDDGDLDPDEARGDLDAIEEASQRLLAQVERILELARLDAGMRAEPQAVSVPALLELVASRHRDDAVEKGLAVHVEDATGGAVVQVNPGNLERLLGDLVHNAVRFTDQGTVTVRAEPARDGVDFVVRDTGIGIAEADQPLVFDLFTQVDGSYTREVDGVGLGLALCRRLADSIGATLAMESEVGVGTTMRLHLPA
ncbi:MAG: HAMP domain-containing histidine kinase [Alphaproteobacteria bacterium]|nr:HAMP domain-containing histidine kinase [Alphaproteobacteria bacterium]